MTEVSVEALRIVSQACVTDECPDGSALLNAAADELERLRDEIAEERGRRGAFMKKANAELVALREENEALRVKLDLADYQAPNGQKTGPSTVYNQMSDHLEKRIARKHEADLAELADWRAGRKTAWVEGEPPSGSGDLVVVKTLGAVEVGYWFGDGVMKTVCCGMLGGIEPTHWAPFNPPEGEDRKCDHEFVQLTDNERFEANGYSRCSKCGRLDPPEGE